MEIIARRLIRADGTEQDLPFPQSTDDIRQLIGAASLDTVQLRRLGHPIRVMFVDDMGLDKRLPLNAKATELYHANCRPGTSHQIRGDVVVTLDEDF